MERNAAYFYKFTNRETGETLLEGFSTGNTKQDCMKLAWIDFMKENAAKKFFDSLHSEKTLYEFAKLYITKKENEKQA